MSQDAVSGHRDTATRLSDDLDELCQELAESNGDDVYTRILDADRAIGDF